MLRITFEILTPCLLDRVKRIHRVELTLSTFTVSLSTFTNIHSQQQTLTVCFGGDLDTAPSGSASDHGFHQLGAVFDHIGEVREVLEVFTFGSVLLRCL